MGNYECRIVFDQDRDAIIIDAFYGGKKLASYRLAEGLDSPLADLRPLDLSAMPAFGRNGERVASVLHAIGMDF